jgi:glyoxylase-like metal-dependent hydrolase (beta-lactamase superfamily II)
MILEAIETGPILENCFIVADENAKSGFVIDPGWDAKRIKRTLDRHGITDVAILLTHGHFDHTSAVAELRKLTGAKVYMSPEDNFLLDSVGGLTASSFGMGGVDKFKPDEEINEGDKFTAGEITLTTLSTPGHTPGGVSFYDGKERVFVGDTLFFGSVGRVDFPRSDAEALIDSITNVLYKLPEDTIVHCGHGPDTTIGHEKRSNPFTRNPGLLY